MNVYFSNAFWKVTKRRPITVSNYSALEVAGALLETEVCLTNEVLNIEMFILADGVFPLVHY